MTCRAQAALLGEPLNGRGIRLGKHGVSEDERPAFPDEEGATGQLPEVFARDQSACNILVKRSWDTVSEGLRQGDATHGCTIIQQRGEVEPNQRWH